MRERDVDDAGTRYRRPLSGVGLLGPERTDGSERETRFRTETR